MRMHEANHLTKCRDPNGGVRGRTEGDERVCNPIGETISTNQTPQSTNQSTHGGTHGSSRICSRGWPYGTSMGGEVLDPMKAQCPSAGEYQDREVGVVG